MTTERNQQSKRHAWIQVAQRERPRNRTPGGIDEVGIDLIRRTLRSDYKASAVCEMIAA